jgi:transposase
VEITQEGLKVEANTKARKFEERIDGKLVVETSSPELTAQELIGRYKEMADIERAFRALKSTLEIQPMYHWTEQRIRAHVFICVLAIQIQPFRSRDCFAPTSSRRTS